MATATVRTTRCPRCAAGAERLDADLGVCLPCRDELRGELTSWLMQLVGLMVLREGR
ncbi:hypothetical protein ACFW1A_21330 [Kitasatospora sp. NPDC058965]|uniref:hypothetical protein n=1 Tax=Kitasatospora sp. NPDC058965 TaxID=3346682 RepID=UPI00368B07D7